MNKEQKISEKVIQIVEDKIGQYPCFVQTPFYTEDVLKVFLKSYKEMWYNHYIDESSVLRMEGLFNYGDSGIYVYYNGGEDKQYRLVFMSDNTKRDSIILTIKGLNKFKIQELWK